MKYTLKKLVYALVTIYIIISISFLLIHLMPGNVIINLVGQEEYYYLLDNNPARLNELMEKYGLADGLGKQYLRYLKSVVTMDFGVAYANHMPVIDNVLRACKTTLMLAIPTWIFGALIGCILGTISGWKPGSAFDKIATPFFLVIQAIPTNCLGLILLILFSYKLQLLPINGMVAPGLEGMAKLMSYLEHIILPLIILILSRVSGNYMLMKSSISTVREEEYLITAESKGMTDRGILFGHALKNALVPYLTSVIMQLGWILSGSMIIEVIFGWNGMGKLMYEAVNHRDFPTAQLCFLITAVSVVMANWLSDVVVAKIDPRIEEATYEQN